MPKVVCWKLDCVHHKNQTECGAEYIYIKLSGRCSNFRKLPEEEIQGRLQSLATRTNQDG